MQNPDIYLSQVVDTLFFCQKIAFCFFVETLLCSYFRQYQLISKSGPGPRCGQSYTQLIPTLFLYFNCATPYEFRYKTMQHCRASADTLKKCKVKMDLLPRHTDMSYTKQIRVPKFRYFKNRTPALNFFFQSVSRPWWVLLPPAGRNKYNKNL